MGMERKFIEHGGRRMGKSIESAVNVYQWLKTARSGSKGIIFCADRTIEITIKEVKK